MLSIMRANTTLHCLHLACTFQCQLCCCCHCFLLAEVRITVVAAKMNDSAVPLRKTVHAVKFECNEDFFNAEERLNEYIPQHKWNPREACVVKSELAATLLATADDAGSSFSVDKFVQTEILFSDLSSLSHEDLEVLGFADAAKRENILGVFSILPNQVPAYKTICKRPHAQRYNREIVQKAAIHMKLMGHIMAAAKYKLKDTPPEDVVLGEKSFASRFVLEALVELRNATKAIEKELADLELLSVEDEGRPKSKRARFVSAGKWIALGSVATAAIAAIWLFRLKG